MARPICLRLLAQAVRLAASRTFWVAGTSSAISTAMMAITTSSSIREKPSRPTRWEEYRIAESFTGEEVSGPVSRGGETAEAEYPLPPGNCQGLRSAFGHKARGIGSVGEPRDESWPGIRGRRTMSAGIARGVRGGGLRAN